jgi:hypothetical protein
MQGCEGHNSGHTQPENHQPARRAQRAQSEGIILLVL